MSVPFDTFTHLLFSRMSVDASAPEFAGAGESTGLFDDLGLDSMQAFQLLVVVEAMAGADLPPEELPPLFTVGDAYRYYRSLSG